MLRGHATAASCASAPIAFSYSQDVDSEACICAALHFGWASAAKAALIDRASKKRPSLRVRQFAQTRHAAAVSFLARMHPRYPRHVKAIPALVWSQNDTMIQVRVRFARYAGGESLVTNIEHTEVLIDDHSLYLRGEGIEKSVCLLPTRIAVMHRVCFLMQEHDWTMV